MLLFFGLLFVALFGARLAPHEATYFVLEHHSGERPFEPGAVFPFGSDVLGRDILSLVLIGSGATLTIVLLSGLARVVAGLALVALSNLVRPLRGLTEILADLISAIPATLVALVIIKVLFPSDTGTLAFVGALLVIGWAGPYRVLRAEIDRLASAPFTEGARAIGVSRLRLFWRHQIPHLLPILAMNLSQQVVAALVLVAELGVLGTFVGTTRDISVEESLTRVVTGPTNATRIADPPEWGGLLANARTVESLWTTRWLVLVPGIALAITAVGVAGIGYALAQHYRRRDIIEDLRGRGAASVVLLTVALVLIASVLPERYAAAGEWAGAAREQVRSSPDLAADFEEAGLSPLGASYEITRESAAVLQLGPGTVKVGDRQLTEPWPKERGRTGVGPLPLRSFVTADTGGGTVEAPLVFAGRGISPSDYPPQPRTAISPPDLGQLIKDWPDDYADIDVRGKIVVLVRFAGVRTDARFNDGRVFGPSGDDQIAKALKRGAIGVMFVDPALPFYTEVALGRTIVTSDGIPASVDPYLRLERDSPATAASGTPVMILSRESGHELYASLGIDVASLTGFVPRGERPAGSPARDLGVTARIAVPLERKVARSISYLAEVKDVAPEIGRVIVWAARSDTGPATNATRDVLGALARTLNTRSAPFVFVEVDASIDRQANLSQLRSHLEARQVVLVIVLDRLEGTRLRFTTASGDLIPAVDSYAQRLSVPHDRTRSTAPLSAVLDVAPLPNVKTIVISGNGGSGDLRSHAAALISYLAGRQVLGAEELPR